MSGNTSSGGSTTAGQTSGADVFDVVIVGAGAAGLATAIFARRGNPDIRVTLLEGARQPGAKILVSGGSRCNVTNAVVAEADFNSGRPSVVRRVLRALPVDDTVKFFAGLGVSLHEEPNGKLFPDTNRSRDVLNALLAEVSRLGVDLRAGTRVTSIVRDAGMFRVTTSTGALTAQAVVLATGGLSLPKTGSDGWGYTAATALGHSIVPTTPALAPLLIDSAADRSIHGRLSGVSMPVRLDVRVDGSVSTRLDGAMLWTHFGVSGPVAMDASRHWLRARLEGRDVQVTASLCPGETFESLERDWVDAVRDRPRATVLSTLSSQLPASVASALFARLGIADDLALARLTREDRRRLIHALLAWPLAVVDSRGYNYAEATAGGVPLDEIDPSTMASRRCPGLFLVGEILDVDGRIGGFNFQWAWSSARVAGQALARRRSAGAS